MMNILVGVLIAIVIAMTAYIAVPVIRSMSDKASKRNIALVVAVLNVIVILLSVFVIRGNII